MTKNTKLSARAEKALDIIADGGRYIYALERNSYTGRVQFKARLKMASGELVKGFGYSTLDEVRGYLVAEFSHPEKTIYRMKRHDDDKGGELGFVVGFENMRNDVHFAA